MYRDEFKCYFQGVVALDRKPLQFLLIVSESFYCPLIGGFISRC